VERRADQRGQSGRRGAHAGLRRAPRGHGREYVPNRSSMSCDLGTSQVGFSAAKRSTNWRSAGTVDRPPVRRYRGWVQCWVTRSRCHRNTVAGVTIRCNRPAWDSHRISAANTARLAQDSRGLLTWRRSTATSCQSTRISAFFDRELRARRPSQATSCLKISYSSRNATTFDHARRPPSQRRRRSSPWMTSSAPTRDRVGPLTLDGQPRGHG
jgi:hypothetical protein